MPTTGELRTGGTVAVVGAGPAGLTLTRLLQTRGFTVQLVERDPSPSARTQGGSLDLRSSTGQEAIRQAGLIDAFERVSRPDATSFRLLDRHGTVRTDHQADSQQENGPEIDRPELRHLLLDSVAPDTIAWGHVLRDVSAEPDGRWRLEFREQEPVTADLVVGADGVHSRIRAALTSVQPRHIGLTMLAAVVAKELWRESALSELLGHGSMLVAGEGQTIWVQRCAHDVIRLYFSVAVPADWPKAESYGIQDTDAVLDFVRKTYHDWSPEMMAEMTQIQGAFEPWPLWVLPPEQQWATRPGITILGDAAHVMPPFTGKGVNLALLDALELADSLTAEPTTELTTALAGYEHRMQQRTRQETGECLALAREIYGVDVDFDGPPR